MHTRTTPTPLELVTQGEIFARCPAALQANWAEAKRQAGQPISPERMARLTPAHLTGRTLHPLDITPRNPVEAEIAPFMRRAQQRVRQIIATTPSGGGDAA